MRKHASLACLISALMLTPAIARDAAFVDPGLSAPNAGTAAIENAIAIEPKSDIDIGDTALNIAKRTTLFFVNKTATPVEISNIAVTGDGNVKTEVASDDCSKEGKIAPSSRCALAVDVTPSAAGPWSVDVLMTHKSPGRLTRARLTGKTAGANAVEKKETGLALSTRDVKPVEFGEVEANISKTVRSVLMVNDSPDPVTLLSIDVIAADNGLERLDQGCTVAQELKPGESCPVTLLWKPTDRGRVSTDLIIRHSGKLGFVVIPVRGTAKGGALESNLGKDSGLGAPLPLPEPVKLPLSVADTLQKAAGEKIPPLPSDLLPPPGHSSKNPESFQLIGTVGSRAVLLKPDGTTAVADVGETITYGVGQAAKLTNVMPQKAELFLDGRRITLNLKAASELTAKAAQLATADKADTKGAKAGSGAASP